MEKPEAWQEGKSSGRLSITKYLPFIGSDWEKQKSKKHAEKALSLRSGAGALAKK